MFVYHLFDFTKYFSSQFYSHSIATFFYKHSVKSTSIFPSRFVLSVRRKWRISSVKLRCPSQFGRKTFRHFFLPLSLLAAVHFNVVLNLLPQKIQFCSILLYSVSQDILMKSEFSCKKIRDSPRRKLQCSLTRIMQLDCR